MKHRYVLGLVLLLLCAFCVVSLADYQLTPADVSDTTVRQKLYELGYLPSPTQRRSGTTITLQALQAFQNDQELERENGMDTRTMVRLFSQTDEEEAQVWAPVYGGKKYHDNPFCSNMNNPESVSLKTAKELGYEPCKRCKPPQK